MDNNKNSSSSSICRKIRQALASNPAILAIQRISSFNQEPKPVTKYPNSPPHHYKARKEGIGANPKLRSDNGKPPASSTTKGASSGIPITVGAKGEREPHPQHVPVQGKQHQHGHVVVHSEQQGKKHGDINEHFKVFIENTRDKMRRSMTNIGWAQSNHPAPAQDQEAHASNKNESHYSDFIQRVGKKLRATTTVRKSGNYLKEK
ncbi:hypothetical protein Fmac_027961 [Flemingia macrophylla]|uniref:Uncharacterized protein n=1 Tax=Flemingia macrophylla TaxID=520843 RepID=A0ABD1LJC0_9FABA